jgi:uncharacterized membrane protein
MSELNKNELHKEFELERMILFSDAVFAIAITLLIIEIKFPELPENYKTGSYLFEMFRHTLKEFLAFAVSFFFIGITWARHLKLFRFLKTYDNKVIFLNLFGLFFIVAFPFSASGITHLKPSFMFPIVIYLGNILMVVFANFLMTHYIFHKNPQLAIPGHEPEKKYIYVQSKYPLIALSISFFVVLIVCFVTDNNNTYINGSVYTVILSTAFANRLVKKYKPKKQLGETNKTNG